MRIALFVTVLTLTCLNAWTQETALPTGWRYYQNLTVEKPGFLKIALPPETMNSTRAGLEDLRLSGTNGQEIPFQVQTPLPAYSRRINISQFTTRVEGSSTIIQLETGIGEPVEALSVDTPEQEFLKPITVTASNDGANWQPLVQSQPIFRRAGASVLQLSLPAGAWKFLRVIADDSRSRSIPITRFTLQTVTKDPNPPTALSTRIIERQESSRDTRVTLDLGAANLYVARVEVVTSEPFFTRLVSVLVPKLQENELVEEEIASGPVSRIQIEGVAPSENRNITVEKQIPHQQIVLVFRNEDAPPLKIDDIRVFSRPTTIGFYAQNPGHYFVLTGNPQASAAKYELNLLREDLSKVPLSDAKLGPLTFNPNYKEPAVLPGVAETGAKIDLSGWRYRKAAHVNGDGPQQLELDLETLSLADSSFRDLRLVQNEAQLPYLLERTGAVRELSPQWNATNDSTRPSVSQWQILLPHDSLPITRISCDVPNPLFQRNVAVYEHGRTSRGEAERRFLGQATWSRKPGQTHSIFTIDLSQAPRSRQLVIETDHGDNPPITIQSVQVSYPVSRVLFKANRTSAIHLYFGNPQAQTPRYDLAIVAEQLVKAEKQTASLGQLEELKRGLTFGGARPSLLFWGVLAVVVIGLFVVISRVLPATRAD